jgi:hypothetical protein
LSFANRLTAGLSLPYFSPSIAIGIHLLLCVVTFFFVMMNPPNLGSIGIIIYLFVFKIAVLLIYFFSGKIFLHDTYNKKTNFASFSIFTGVLLMGIFVLGPDIILLSFYPFIVILGHFGFPFIIQLFIQFLLLFLPALLMWSGMKKNKAPAALKDN